MSLRFLLDTNVVSEPPRPAPNPGVLRRLRQYEGMVGIAAVVWHEMLFGSERLPPSRRRSDIENYLLRVVLKTMPILAYDPAAAEWHARQRARLVGMGKTPAYSDGQIAAVLSYLRREWGHHANPITLDQIARIRLETKDRGIQWTEKELLQFK